MINDNSKRNKKKQLHCFLYIKEEEEERKDSRRK